jgi:hypothetical protein
MPIITTLEMTRSVLRLQVPAQEVFGEPQLGHDLAAC